MFAYYLKNQETIAENPLELAIAQEYFDCIFDWSKVHVRVNSSDALVLDFNEYSNDQDFQIPYFIQLMLKPRLDERFYIRSGTVGKRICVYVKNNDPTADVLSAIQNIFPQIPSNNYHEKKSQSVAVPTTRRIQHYNWSSPCLDKTITELYSCGDHYTFFSYSVSSDSNHHQSINRNLSNVYKP